jgi:uncharacterized membrane protein YjdF
LHQIDRSFARDPRQAKLSKPDGCAPSQWPSDHLARTGRDWLELSRNPYDKLGHFMQGLVPALLIREILLRLCPVELGRMLGFLSVWVALAFAPSTN